ncbi:MAG: CDP-alcohol phosphatidyltransferase family protein, partial [Caulobacterales bacterium]
MGPAAEFGLAVGSSAARIWGMTGTERLHRMFRRATMTPISAEQIPGSGSAGVLVARADWVFEERLISTLAKRRNAVLTGPDGAPLAAHVAAADAAETAQALLEGRTPPVNPAPEKLDPETLAYDLALRKREPPVLEPLTSDNVRQVEARLFKASYKGVTDVVTKYWWPMPARIVTRWCALAGISPNMVTFAGFLLVLAAFYLFWKGDFGWGLVCAWIMTFLDTVDGKLARVTLTSSSIGNIFDHGIDLIHPPFWWWAWLVGVQAVGFTIENPSLILWVIVGGYVAQRVEEGIFMRSFKMHMHAWRPFDSWFRLYTARRNPNLLLLTPAAMIGRPDIGIVLVAIWTAAS